VVVQELLMSNSRKIDWWLRLEEKVGYLGSGHAPQTVEGSRSVLVHPPAG
jgi:hypothetical protein